MAAFNGHELRDIELREWGGRDTSDLANGMVVVSFVFAYDRMTITNAR